MGGIKQVSPAQMTHDMVLRPGPLFMASHVSEGWLPQGAPRLLPAFASHPRPGRHTAEYPHRPAGRMNSDRHGRGGMRTCLRSLLKSNRFLPGGLLSRATFSAAAPFLKKRAEAGKCRRGGASPRPTPSAHSLFYQPLSCGEGCEIWRESADGGRRGDLNALPL